MLTDFSLEWLLAPFPTQKFLDEHWETTPLVIQRNRPDYYAKLLSLADVDRYVTTSSAHHPAISLVNAARQVRTEEYTFPSGMVDVARLYQQYADGGTIILEQLHLKLPTLAALCRSMERELSTRFQTNVYLTGRNAQGFKPHYDSHDVFAIQVHGSKHWITYESPVELPYRGQAFDPAEVKPGPVAQEFTLRAGDVVYLPRGVMHDARTTDEDSLHITLGVIYTSWTDLLLESLAMVGLHDPAFRRALPPGFARADFDRTEARRTFKTLLQQVVERADFDAALDHFIDDLVTTRAPLLYGQLDQVAKLGKLSPESRAGARPNLVYRIEETDAEVSVKCYGARTTLPRHAAPALRYALEHADYRVGDLPGGLDDDGKVVLVRRLVREGMVRLL